MFDVPLDALSYDFYPLQGAFPLQHLQGSSARHLDGLPKGWSQSKVGRVSALEVAIRAQVKRFLAHPLVVQQLQAIWAGTIIFHSAADNIHRTSSQPVPTRSPISGTINIIKQALRVSGSESNLKKKASAPSQEAVLVRRTVTIYDPRDASLFKLSRLRVPRYRNFLSTCSFAVLLGLYLTVLTHQSLQITSMEVIFWFWSAGFMLDELVGFTEQGFGLYIMSFWNIFDLGILMLLAIYCALRLYGILMSEDRQHAAAEMAYDVLGATAVFLFPRLFSVLDHYRYFSQLLVAFRLMAVDLAAIFVLIMISCSGFFVAFTLSFGNEAESAGKVAYALFQMVLGFTPAAWNVWDEYNLLGKAVLTLFLFMCHFLIVTILITVLTNSFMAIVANANEEHQFLFAVNTISMVKSDALFSYIAPTNIVAWLLTPLRFFIPLRSYVKLNRTVIKVTHFPVLLLIYLYERFVLSLMAFELTDLVHDRGRSKHAKSTQGATGMGVGLFGSTLRIRQESRAGLQGDRALEEVFRRPFRGNPKQQTRSFLQQREASNVVNTWMRDMRRSGSASPPVEQDRLVVERLETRPYKPRRPRLAKRRTTSATRDFTDAARSAISDPEGFVSSPAINEVEDPVGNSDLIDMSMEEGTDHTSGEGDDESVAREVAEKRVRTKADYLYKLGKERPKDIKSRLEPLPGRRRNDASALPSEHGIPDAVNPGTNAPMQDETSLDIIKPSRQGHSRNFSSATILYNPLPGLMDEPSVSIQNHTTSVRNTPFGSGGTTPRASGKRSPQKNVATVSRPRLIAQSRSEFQSAPNLTDVGMFERRARLQHQPSSLALDIGSDMAHGGDDDDEEDSSAFPAANAGGVPSSFATQMAIATGIVQTRHGAFGGDAQRMSRLMLTRMQTLEEGLKEVVRELKELRRDEARDNDKPTKSMVGKEHGRKAARERRNSVGGR